MWVNGEVFARRSARGILEMKVRSFHGSSAVDLADLLARSDILSHPEMVCAADLQVREQGSRAVAVLDYHMESVSSRHQARRARPA
jgi:hypothetical protein